MRIASHLLVAAVCAAVAVPARPAPIRVDLGTLGGTETFAVNMNDRGQVVGCSRTGAGDLHAFVWDASRGMTDLGIDAANACASDVNDGGQVVGYALDDSGAPAWAFLWEASTVTDLGPGGAFDINDVGQVLGGSGQPFGTPEPAAWVWESGVRRPLPLPVSGWFTPIGINDAGRVVGSVCDVGCRAIVWDVSAGGVVTTALGLSGKHEQAVSLNANGEVLVQIWRVDASTTDSALLWTGDAIVPLGTLGGAGTAVMTLSWKQPHLNDRGEVVGSSQIADGDWHGFLWSAGEMLDLGLTLDPFAINDAGQVAGAGWFPGSTHSSAFLWSEGTAVPIGYPDLPSDATVVNERGDALVRYSDAAGHERAFVWIASVPDDIAAVWAVSDAVSLLSARGELTRNTLDALDAMLDAAGARAAAGEPCAAVGILGAFQNKIAALVRAGKLPPASAQDVIDLAARSAAALGGSCR